MGDFAIQTENLGKVYHIGTSAKPQLGRLTEDISNSFLSLFRKGTENLAQKRGELLWAVRNISLEIGQGEVVGIIGRNGAGKSTLLKLLARITEPTEGVSRTRGRVCSLLEVGVGFHAELTGRENIFLNGAILGMSKVEIDNKFDEIVAFAEIERFIDTPVKWYSSGMYVRLAFGVAATMEPETLVVDEVLAVGDAAFQRKCIEKMTNVAREGRTIVFVSHNMALISSFCERIIYLESGRIKADGPTQDILSQYLQDSADVGEQKIERLRARHMGARIRITEIKLISQNGPVLVFGNSLIFEVHLISDVNSNGLRLGTTIFNNTGEPIGSLITREEFSVSEGGSLKLLLEIPRLDLAPGRYYCGFSIGYGGIDSFRIDEDVIQGLPVFDIVPTADESRLIAHWEPRWGHVVIRDANLKVGD
jgi:lipopolysaccharide transport system ATP-binding protein